MFQGSWCARPIGSSVAMVARCGCSGIDLTLAAGSRIDADGATGANAGACLCAHRTAALAGGCRQGAAAPLWRVARSICMRRVDRQCGLVSALQVGGFTETQSVHVRNGDLNLPAGETVTARNIEWTSDLGNVNIDGTMRAPSQTQRSAIRLYGTNVSDRCDRCVERRCKHRRAFRWRHRARQLDRGHLGGVRQPAVGERQ